MIDRITNKLKREIDRWIVNNFYILKNSVEKNKYPNPKMKGVIETLEYILDKNCSVSRYGDGEIKWILGVRQDSFQQDNQELSERLDEVIRSQGRNHIICIANGFAEQTLFNKETQKFWAVHMGKYRKKWISHLDLEKQYYSTDISRCYLSYNSLGLTLKAFDIWKKIFSNRDILIVEGDKTRFGVGNNLLDSANSIHRILVPAVNAFGKYDDIINSVIKYARQKDLIILAIGPTATVMAYDLAQLGYQAIDIGHLDIEYEWFCAKATSKIAIKGKYVNEAGWLGGRDVADSYNPKYIREIICDLS